MNTMHLALLILGLIGLVAIVVTVVALATAPIGYEDETGFHPAPLPSDIRRPALPIAARRLTASSPRDPGQLEVV